MELSVILFLIELLSIVTITYGQVEIVKPYHPLYVKAGDSLELLCNSTNRLQLEWVRQTPNTSWRDTPIVPFVGSDFVTTYTVEEPTGNVRTTMIKKDMRVYDRGMYMCRDKFLEHSFAVWVTVLKILKTPDTRLVRSKSNHFLLNCNITGFDNNLPRLQYEWSLNQQTIEPKNTKYIYGSPEEGIITLNVTKAARSDGGTYECTFFVSTSLGPLSFTESIRVDAGLLEASGAAKISFQLTHLLFIWCLIFVLSK